MSIRRSQPIPAIIHRDDDVLVINKPAGLLSVAARGDAVVIDVMRQSGALEVGQEVRVVHRLDKEVSGVMVYALNLKAQQDLTLQFSQRTVEKTYLALVTGTLKGAGEINLPLHVDRDKRIVKISERQGKPSLTDYWVLEKLNGYSLVECHPRTGRLHQIRVHLAAIGHPLVVDPLYGGKKPLLLSNLKSDYQPSFRHPEQPLMSRVSLHAQRLSFDHPTHLERATFEAPLPKDFQRTLNQLRRLTPNRNR